MDVEYAELKMQRASMRGKHLIKKRSDYERSRTTPSYLADGGASTRLRRKIKPHRNARAANRTSLAKGLDEAKADMPSICMRRTDAWSMMSQKPCVSAVAGCKEDDEEGDHVFFEECLMGELEFDSDDKIGSQKEAFVPESATLTEGSMRVAQAEAVITLFSANTAEGTLSDWPVLVSRPSEKTLPDAPGSLVEHLTCTESEESAEEHSSPCNRDESTRQQERAARNTILRGVLAAQQRAHDAETLQLREEMQLVREAEQAALAAKAQAQDAEQKAREAEVRARELPIVACEDVLGARENELQQQSLRTAEIKWALQLEKQRSAEYRKKRNQAVQMQSLKEKADRTLQEAREIKEQAEAEAFWVSAQLLAEAQQRAKSEADVQVQVGLQALAVAEAEMKARVDAEVQAAKYQAARDAMALKEEAVAVARAEAEERARVEVEAAKSRAEADVLKLKTRAQIEANVIKARAKAEVRESAEKDAERVRAEVRAQEAAAVEREKQLQREAASALKQAKVLEQQRAKKFRKLAEQERQEEHQKQQELAKADEERETRSRACQEEQRLAKEEAEAMLQQASQTLSNALLKTDQLLVEARGKAEAEAVALKAAAEVEANAIKAKAEEDARSMKRQIGLLQAQAELEAIADLTMSVFEPWTQSPALDAPELQCVHSSEAGWEIVPDSCTQPLLKGDDWDVLA